MPVLDSIARSVCVECQVLSLWYPTDSSTSMEDGRWNYSKNRFAVVDTSTLTEFQVHENLIAVIGVPGEK